MGPYQSHFSIRPMQMFWSVGFKNGLVLGTDVVPTHQTTNKSNDNCDLQKCVYEQNYYPIYKIHNNHCNTK